MFFICMRLASVWTTKCVAHHRQYTIIWYIRDAVRCVFITTAGDYGSCRDLSNDGNDIGVEGIAF